MRLLINPYQSNYTVTVKVSNFLRNPTATVTVTVTVIVSINITIADGNGCGYGALTVTLRSCRKFETFAVCYINYTIMADLRIYTNFSNFKLKKKAAIKTNFSVKWIQNLKKIFSNQFLVDDLEKKIFYFIALFFTKKLVCPKIYDIRFNPKLPYIFIFWTI